jgi:magnesium transporter
MHSLARSRQSHGSSQNEDDRVEELEMLLEAYFVVIDGTLNKLTSVSFCYLSSSDELQFI